MVTHTCPRRLTPALLLAAATVAIAPAVGAQVARATVAVSARIAPLRSGLSLLPSANGSIEPVATSGTPASSLARDGLRVRAASAYEVRVWRRAGRAASALDGRATVDAAGRGDRAPAQLAPAQLAPSDTARVWVRDDRGGLRPLATGESIALGTGQPGERRSPGLDYEVDATSAGHVDLVYEVRLVGGAQ